MKSIYLLRWIAVLGVLSSGCMMGVDEDALDEPADEDIASVGEALSFCPQGAQYCFWSGESYTGNVIPFYDTSFWVPNTSTSTGPIASLDKRGPRRVEIWSMPSYKGACTVLGQQGWMFSAPGFPWPPQSVRTIGPERPKCKPGA